MAERVWSEADVDFFIAGGMGAGYGLGAGDFHASTFDRWVGGIVVFLVVWGLGFLMRVARRWFASSQVVGGEKR